MASGSSASTYIMGGFGAFVLLMIIYHCYLKHEHRKKVEDVIMRDAIGKMTHKGIMIISRQKQREEEEYL